MSNFTNTDDVIDVRDIIARVEELRDEIQSCCTASAHGLEREAALKSELETLENLLEELKGCGGDERWEGDWYPITLVRDSHFEDYAEELAEDIGAINRDASWPNNCIDWERAARELLQDYSSVEFDGVTYWYR